MQRIYISASVQIPDSIKKLTEKQVERAVVKALTELAKNCLVENPKAITATASATEI